MTVASTTAVPLTSMPSSLITTAVVAPVTNPSPSTAGQGQSDPQSVNAEVLGLVFSDFDNHERSGLVGDDLGSALADLLSGLALDHQRD
jgi:hypothetical protein